MGAGREVAGVDAYILLIGLQFDVLTGISGGLVHALDMVRIHIEVTTAHIPLGMR